MDAQQPCRRVAALTALTDMRVQIDHVRNAASTRSGRRAFTRVAGGNFLDVLRMLGRHLDCIEDLPRPCTARLECLIGVAARYYAAVREQHTVNGAGRQFPRRCSRGTRADSKKKDLRSALP